MKTADFFNTSLPPFIGTALELSDIKSIYFLVFFGAFVDAFANASMEGEWPGIPGSPNLTSDVEKSSMPGPMDPAPSREAPRLCSDGCLRPCVDPGPPNLLILRTLTRVVEPEPDRCARGPPSIISMPPLGGSSTAFRA